MAARLAPYNEPHVSSRRTPERHRRAGLGFHLTADIEALHGYLSFSLAIQASASASASLPFKKGGLFALTGGLRRTTLRLIFRPSYKPMRSPPRRAAREGSSCRNRQSTWNNAALGSSFDFFKKSPWSAQTEAAVRYPKIQNAIGPRAW
jgi:hypothetical protein